MISSFSWLIRKMLCSTLMVFLLGDFLISVVADDCSGLPTTTTDVQPALRTLLANTVGEDQNNITVTILSGPFFTFQVQCTAVGAYQKVSLIVRYTSNHMDHVNVVGQFEMICVFGALCGDNISNSLSTPGVNYTTITLWTNCSDCVTNSPPNENNCQRKFQPL